MLRAARSKCTVISKHSSCRAQSTAAAASSATSSTKVPDLPPPTPRKHLNRRTIYVRPWDGVSSMVEAFAIVRGIERKFGKIRSFHFARDYEVSEIYQPYFWAEFEEESSMENVPTDPKSDASVVQIDIPVFNTRQPGGVGLTDLYGLLESKDRVTEVEKPWESVVTAMATGEPQETSQNAPGMRTVSVKIERTGFIPGRSMYGTPPLSTRQMLEVGRSFALWGGFYQPPPPPASAEEDVDDSSKSSQKAKEVRPLPSLKHMRAAQAKWEPILNRKKGDAQPTPDVEDTAEEASTELFLADATLPGEQSVESTTEPPVAATAPTTEAPAIARETVSAPTPVTSPQKTPRMTRRMRMLEQARQIARTPLPESVKPPTTEELKAKEEQERQEVEDNIRAEQTMRERLQNLIGGKWF